MRTNVVLDDAPVRAALRFSGAKTKIEVFETALREFVATHGRRDLRELKGKVRFRKGYDYKALRKGLAQ